MFQVSGREADSKRVEARKIRKFVWLAVVLIVVGAVWAFAPPADAKPCANANRVPKAATDAPKLQVATRCLINVERKKKGLVPLKVNGPLQKSSAWQADDMLQFQYFDHFREGGPEFGERILRFGYADDADGYAIGENIAWASSPIATPKKIVKLWMNSPPHRKNILTKGYRDQGLVALWSAGGVGGAYKDSGGPFVIFVNQFGQRQ